MPAIALVALLVAAILPATADPATPLVADVWSARLVGLNSSYGPEDWKYSLSPSGTSPQAIISHAENESTSYAGAVGLKASLTVQIYNTQDSMAVADERDYTVAATIETPRGPIRAYTARMLPAAENKFLVNFDMDGANNADPNGDIPPPAEPGLQNVHLVIQRRVNDNPPVVRTGEADFEFSYDMPVQSMQVPSLEGRPYQQFVPDSIFRLFTDVGWDRSVLFATRAVRSTDSIQLEYEFLPESTGQQVQLYRLIAERSYAAAANAPNAPAPLPTLPFIPGVSDNDTLKKATETADRFVNVEVTAIAGALQTVDADGIVRFQVGAENLLRSGHANDLVVLAPVLESNFDVQDCGENCVGGAEYRIGATELVLPVTIQNVSIARYKLLNEGSSAPSAAPEPVRDAAMAANALQVYVRDDDRFTDTTPPESRAGDLYALLPGTRSLQPLAGGGLSPSQSDTDMLSGNLAVRNIQEAGVNVYRVFALVYSAQDRFYGLAFGDRGYRLQLDPVEGDEATSGGLWVNVTSATTNYDEVPEDPGFEIPVTLTVKLGERTNLTKRVTVKELGETATFFEVPVPETGDVPVIVDSTSGDLTPGPASAIVRFAFPEDDGGSKPKIPAPDALFVLASASLALLIWRRR